MAFCNRLDPGKVNAWRNRVSSGVSRSHRQCPACRRHSNGGRGVFIEERLSIWRCRYCGHEIATRW